MARSVQRLRDSNAGRSMRCFFSETSGPTLDPTQHPIQRVQRYSSARVKWPRREDDLPPSKIEWRRTYKTPVSFRFPFNCFTFFVVWCTASLSTTHIRLEQVLIPALCMPIQKIKSSNLAPDNGYPTWGFRVIAQYIRTTTGLQKVLTSSWCHSATRRAMTDAPVRHDTHNSRSWSTARSTPLDKDI